MSFVDDLAKAAEDFVGEFRADGWINAITGFGTAKDKTTFTRFGGEFCHLTDAQCTAMYSTEDLAARIVDVYPREAMREGFELGGLDDKTQIAVRDFLAPYNVSPAVIEGAIWGRVYGGAAIWMGSYTQDPARPFQIGEQIDFLRVVDKRHLTPADTHTLDVLGRPVMYQVSPPDNGQKGQALASSRMVDVRVSRVHASRLILFPGALTDAQTRAGRSYWDLSILQRPYDALRNDGTIWGGAMQLLTEASIGVVKIKNLWNMAASGEKDRLMNRLETLRLGRSISRHMTLDADKEDFTRVNTTFSGVSDLVDRAIKRIAAAAEIPVTVLMGEAPAGLNATGDSDLRWFLQRIQAYRVYTIQQRLLSLVTALLSQPGAPSGVPVKALSIVWPELWTPTAKERSEIYTNTANGDGVYFDRGVLTSKEIAKSRFGTDGYSQETVIDRELREGEDTTDDPETEASLAPTPDGGAPAPVAGGPAGADVQKQALNGAQVTGLIEVVRATALKEIPYESAVQIVALAFQLSEEEAKAIIGPAGQSFTKEPPPPPAPFGGAPPPKKPDAPPAPPPKDDP